LNELHQQQQCLVLGPSRIKIYTNKCIILAPFSIDGLFYQSSFSPHNGAARGVRRSYTRTQCFELD